MKIRKTKKLVFYSPACDRCKYSEKCTQKTDLEECVDTIGIAATKVKNWECRVDIYLECDNYKLKKENK